MTPTLHGSPPPRRRHVLVLGATGRLGAIVEVLLARGHTVRAATRDTQGVAAERLARLGTEVARADFDDPSSLRAAAAGVDAVFATGTAHRAGPEGELRHGLNVADAALAAGVGHLVYASGQGAAADSELPLYRAKHAVEERVRSLSIPATILAPVYFMENLLNPWNVAALQAGVFPSPIRVEAPLQQLAVADLVAFAVLAIERPDELAGRRIALASDEVTANQAAAALSEAARREFRARSVASDQLPPGLGALFAWLERSAPRADIADLRTSFPDLGWHRYRDWARAVAALIPAPPGSTVGSMPG